MASLSTTQDRWRVCQKKAGLHEGIHEDISRAKKAKDQIQENDCAMKNIEKLRANSLTLVEAKYLADKIDQLAIYLGSLEVKMVKAQNQNRLRIAQDEEDGAWLGHVHAERKLHHLILLRKIREWEVRTGQSHKDLLDGKEALDDDL